MFGILGLTNWTEPGFSYGYGGNEDSIQSKIARGVQRYADDYAGAVLVLL